MGCYCARSMPPLLPQKSLPAYPLELAATKAATDLFAATTIAAAATTANQFSIFENGGNTYIYHQNGTLTFDTGYGLIQLTGVKVADLTATNFLH